MGQSNPGEAGTCPERWFLLLTAGLIGSYTLAPFEFSFAHMGSRLKEVFAADPTAGLPGVLGHFLTFLFLGALVASVNEESIRRTGFRRFMLHSALVCAVLECLQLALPARHARVADLSANTLGLWMGAGGSMNWCWFRKTWLTSIQWSRQHYFVVPSIVVLSVSGIWAGAGIFPMSRLSSMDWNEDFRLLIGGELDHDEGSWLGEFRQVSVYGRALNSQEALRAFAGLDGSKGNESGGTLHLLARYDFTTSAQAAVFPAGLLSPEGLSMPVPATCQWLNGRRGLQITEPALLASRDRASDLTKAIQSAGEFTVEAWIRPLRATQGHDGPARIISLSDGIWSRNFMLGQEDSDLVFRVRNGINGTNGLSHALRIPGAFDDSLQHFAATYDHGVSQVFRNGRLLSPIVDLRDPGVYLGLGNSPGSHAAMGMLLVLMVALPMYSVCAFLKMDLLRHIVAILTTLMAGSLPYAASCFVMGGPWRSSLHLWQGIALCIAYPPTLMYVMRSHVGGTTRSSVR